jgi:uncharacterized protein (TIGR02421 family)
MIQRMPRARESPRLSEGREHESGLLPEIDGTPVVNDSSELLDDSHTVENHSAAMSLPPPPLVMPSEGPWRSYKEKLASLADRAIELQRPIRILNALKWEPGVWDSFRKSRFKEMPLIDAESYARVDLGFDHVARAREFQSLADDVRLTLGADDAMARILRATCLEYRDVCRMLGARGTSEFYAYSRRLYGSPKDTFPDGTTTVRDIARTLYTHLTSLGESQLGGTGARDLEGAQVVDILRERFRSYFGEDVVNVMLDDGILADAAAGSDYVKIRGGARFSQMDVDLLEVHEGWVHVATSLNGASQHVARWLSKGPPRTTSVQEGLAALMEVLTFRSHPRRARRLNERVLAVDKAEDGADFLDVFEWYRTEGYDEEDCFNAARRVFRGGTLSGQGPFTKDIAYTRGLVANYHYIRSAIRACRPELVRFLFVGKVAHEDVPVLYARMADGVVRPPRYLPPLFSDLSGLGIWMAYSGFFSQMGAQAMHDYYVQLFQQA